MSAPGLDKTASPWYREPWPWILMGLPGTVVVAGIVTLVIAVRNADGLVAEDYYKQGLAINQVLERESKAASLGLKAQLMFSGNQIRIRLEGASSSPDKLVARFIHPIKAAEDRELVLSATAPGWFEATLPQLNGVRWRLQLEDMDANWRLNGIWTRQEQSMSMTAGGNS